MKYRLALLVVGTLVCFGRNSTLAQEKSQAEFTKTFDIDKSELSSTGASRYFILEPGFYSVLEGTDKGKAAKLTITVLKETKMVDGVETRVVEERQTAAGQIEEISRNYFAISKRTGDVFYFGEDTDTYKNGKVVSHEGSWLSGVAGAHFGLMLAGHPAPGARYFQELAPKVAMDRAEVLSVTETVQTPAGKFTECVKTEDSSALETGKEYKFYAPEVGLIQDDRLKLTKYGRSAQ